MRNKRFTSKFYTIDYYKVMPVSKAPDDTMIQCTICNDVSADIINMLESKFGFIVSDTENKLFAETNHCKLHSIDGVVKKKHINAVKEMFKAKNLATKIIHEKYVYCFCEIPGGFLYSGWATGIKTKIKASDLPKSYVYLFNYKKHGYLETAGVKDIHYIPSKFHNHAFKDDFLFLSYDEAKKLSDNTTFEKACQNCDEYVFGNDIINVIRNVEKNNKDNAELQGKLNNIKNMMCEQYNAYVKESATYDKEITDFSEFL